jgi:hypothetical protein
VVPKPTTDERHDALRRNIEDHFACVDRGVAVIGEPSQVIDEIPARSVYVRQASLYSRRPSASAEENSVLQPGDIHIVNPES